MRRCSAALCAAAVLLTACGGAHPAGSTHVEALSVVRNLGCSGWFEVTGRVLAAHLAFTGPVRNVVIRTTSDNGEAPTDDVTVHVPSGVTRRTVYVPGVTRIVVATQATVDNGAAVRATCALATPH
jgi:hypothetical protein